MRKGPVTIICGIILIAGLYSCHNSAAETAKTQKIIDSLVQRQTFIADSMNLSCKTLTDSLNQAHKAIIDSLTAPKQVGPKEKR